MKTANTKISFIFIILCIILFCNYHVLAKSLKADQITYFFNSSKSCNLKCSENQIPNKNCSDCICSLEESNCTNQGKVLKNCECVCPDYAPIDNLGECVECMEDGDCQNDFICSQNKCVNLCQSIEDNCYDCDPESGEITPKFDACFTCENNEIVAIPLKGCEVCINGQIVYKEGGINCGKECCLNGIPCQENRACCETELCNGKCCSSGEKCSDEGICVCENGEVKNSEGYCCPENEVEVEYYTTAGKRQQTCCPRGTSGADSNGQCCPEGLIGTFGYNHSLVYFTRCCPKEGQEDKAMKGLIGLSETWGCAPPDTTMAATGFNNGANHSYYVPIGSLNVDGAAYACGPEDVRSGSLHESCGTAGYYCKNGQKNANKLKDNNAATCYCLGEVIDGTCYLPDCTKPRQHIAYCYCNPEKGSYLEISSFGGTWTSDYANDVCVTPNISEGETGCTQGYTFEIPGYSNRCYSCSQYIARYAYKITDKDNCFKCDNTVWSGTSCMYCNPQNNQKANSERSACVCGDNSFLDISGTCRSCSNNWYYKADKQACNSCLKGTTMWSEYNGYNYCFSCSYAGDFYAWFTKEECDQCPNRYFVLANATTGKGYCYLKK